MKKKPTAADALRLVRSLSEEQVREFWLALGQWAHELAEGKAPNTVTPTDHDHDWQRSLTRSSYQLFKRDLWEALAVRDVAGDYLLRTVELYPLPFQVKDALDKYLALTEICSGFMAEVFTSAGIRVAGGPVRDEHSMDIWQEAERLKAAGLTWKQIAKTLWKEHPEWFPDVGLMEAFHDKPYQMAEQLSRLKERIRDRCR